MKKTLAILLSIVLVFSLTGCSAKRIKRDENGNIIDAEPKKKLYAEMNFEEKLEYMDEHEKKQSSIKTDCGMVAPACFKGSPEYGYVNNLGDWFLAPQYMAAYGFNEGFAPVLDLYSDYEYINSNGELISLNLPKNVTLKAARHFHEGYAAVVADTGYEQTKLYISSNGLSQINAENFPTVKNTKYQSKTYFAVATPFKNGNAVVMRKTNASLLEANSKEQIEKKNLLESAYVIDKSGQILTTLPAGYDITDYSLNANNTIIAKDIMGDNQYYGVLNMEGTPLIPFRYHTIEYCDNDLFLVQNDDGFFGFIASTGIIKSEFKYEAAYPYANGYAAVEEDGLWGIIDKDGNYVVEPKYNGIGKLVTPDMDFNVGGAAVVDGIFAAQYGSYWALLNLKGDILDATYAPNADCPYYNESAGQFIVYKEYVDGIATGFCGLIDIEGKEVLPAEYTYIGCFTK